VWESAVNENGVPQAVELREVNTLCGSRCLSLYVKGGGEIHFLRKLEKKCYDVELTVFWDHKSEKLLSFNLGNGGGGGGLEGVS